MNWFEWLLIGWWTMTAFAVIGNIGKPRKPTEPLTAAIVVAINAAFIVGVILVGA
jgi:hypothetical protein